ncbi:MAG TPA: DUF1844 domain-containing protein [Blastocatellia bacterium]|nr:DUF1844 domain-containing protein [Blastocatellia bacterium]
MAEEKDTNFKVTDRRKFNADGTPRDYSDEPPAAQPAKPAEPPAEAPAQAEQPEAEPANVVSFPGEAERKREKPQAPAEQGAPDQTYAEASRPVGAAEQAYSQTTTGQPRGLPEASFLSLINMLAVEAAMHLGLIETPGDAAPAVDLEAARHMIDMLGVLEQKTRGNLSPDEDKLLENILADLRMHYVALSRRR